MAKIRKSSLWLRGSFGALIAFIFSLLHLSPPAWAADERDAIKALNQKINLLMEECSRDKTFDDNFARSLQNLDAVVKSYLDGDARMCKISLAPQDQPGVQDVGAPPPLKNR